ncbi:MAG: glycosyltransferase [Chitinophagaceae bacterium]
MPDWKYNKLIPKRVIHPDRDKLILMRAWASLADVARLQALFRNGGIYLDTDMEIVFPFGDELLERSWICIEGQTTLCNAAMGAVKGDVFYQMAHTMIQQYDLVKLFDHRMANYAGPELVSALYRNTIGQWPQNTCQDGFIPDREKDVRIFPKRYFYPYSWNEAPCPPASDSYGIHLWKGSWKEPVKPMKQAFIDTYRDHSWQSTHPSGPGSTFEATKGVAAILKRVIETYKIKSMIDAPCGVFSWVYEHGVLQQLQSYIGFDIVPEAIRDSQNAAADVVNEGGMPYPQFHEMDLVNDGEAIEEWSPDLIFSRHMTQHLSTESTEKFLNSVLSSNAKYLLITSQQGTDTNNDVVTWGKALDDYGYRPQNLDLPPFNLSKRAKFLCTYSDLTADGDLNLYKLR